MPVFDTTIAVEVSSKESPKPFPTRCTLTRAYEPIVGSKVIGASLCVDGLWIDLNKGACVELVEALKATIGSVKD